MILLKTFLLKNYKGMTLWPFLLVKDKQFSKDLTFMNHENIHAAQQKELLIVLFYLWYGVDYFIKFMKYKNHHQAYRNIVFEREAYFHETDHEYLKNRKLFSFWKFYDKKNVHG
jgi:hypothetical protein